MWAYLLIRGQGNVKIYKRGGIIQGNISAIRAIAMILIIVCHFLQYYENELCRWLNVGVQIFFIISGYLYGKKSIEDPIRFIYKVFKKILVPYYLFLIIALILYSIFYREYLTPQSIYKVFFCAGVIKGLGHLWFIGYILFCYLITPYLTWVRQKIHAYSLVMSLSIVTLLVISVNIISYAFESYFHPDRISCYIIGFFIPIISEKAGMSIKRTIIRWISVIAITMNMLRVYVKYIQPDILSKNLVSAIVIYAHLLLGVALFITLFYLLKKVPFSKLLLWSDKYSYTIYIVHLLFILSPFTLMAFTSLPILNIVLALSATFVSAMILHKLSSQISQLKVQTSSHLRSLVKTR